MKIIGKKNDEEIQELRAELMKNDHKDHVAWECFKAGIFAVLSFFTGAAMDAILCISADQDPHKVSFISRLPYSLPLSVVIFLILYLVCKKKYKFNENDVSLPEVYRYYMLTREKNVVREDLCVFETEMGSRASLDIYITNAEGKEEYSYGSVFPVELKRDIEETIVDLDAEKVYISCDAQDIKFEEDEDVKREDETS